MRDTTRVIKRVKCRIAGADPGLQVRGCTYNKRAEGSEARKFLGYFV